jgi:hypothetical protein
MFVCVGYFIYLILLALLLDLDLIKIYQGKKANNKIKYILIFRFIIIEYDIVVA